MFDTHNGVKTLRNHIYGLLLLILIPISSFAYNANACPCYGPTFENEHLYRIAMRVRPNPCVTIQQVMVAILRSNPMAFANNNVNELKAGYRLHIPSLACMQSISPETAFNTVNLQNHLWKKCVNSGPVTTTYIAKHVAKKAKAAKVAKPAEAANDGKIIDQIPSIENSATSDKNTASNTNKTTVLDLANKQESGDQTPVNEQQVAANQVETDQIQNKVDGFIQESKQLQQQTNTQIAALQSQTKDLQTKVNQLTDQLKAVTYQVIQTTPTNATSGKSLFSNPAFLNNLKQHSAWLLGSFVVLLFLLFLLAKSFKSKKTAAEIKRDEYDYMGSQDSIPSKLDLASAYIDMGDHKAAEKALKDVLARGNEEQRKAARDLMSKMNQGK